mmetsp:Transcript_7393/g.15850  ORF Transcript_7393/g.15850 Transcript_7393/m.15850 type:complete len:416 (-) Transcript_7393:899-2146(-)
MYSLGQPRSLTRTHIARTVLFTNRPAVRSSCRDYILCVFVDVLVVACLRPQSFRIAGEPRCLANVGEPQKQHDDALQSDASPTVGQGTVLEAVHVALLELDAPGLGALLQQIDRVDSLGTAQDLLATDKEIVAVGKTGVFGIGHRVKGADVERILVHEEKVGPVFFGHQVPEHLFVFRGQVFVIVLVDTGFPQELASLGVRQLEGGFAIPQVFEGVLLPDGFQLALAALVDSVKNVYEQVREQIKDLVVVFLDDHFQIEPGEFAQVAAGVGVLRSKDGPGDKDLFEAGAGAGLLLLELRAHGQRGRLSEIIQGKDVGSALGGAPQKFGGMQFNKSLVDQQLAKEHPNHGLDPEDSLVGGRSQVDPSVVQSVFQSDRRHAIGSLLDELVVGLVHSNVGFLSLVGPHGVLHLEGHGL